MSTGRLLFNSWVPSIARSSTASLLQSGSRSASTVPNVPLVGKGMNQSNRAEAQLRRFWKTVGIQPVPSSSSPTSYLITLDGRSLKTPSGKKLEIPAQKKVAAMMIANEWENQKEVMKVSGLPMTSIASRALDGLSDPETKQGVIDELLRYLDTDTTCFPEDHPSTLVSLQEKNWVPLHQYFEKVHGIKIKSYENLVLGGGQKFRQDQKTRDVLRRVVESWDAWQIAGLERATYATKSFLTAFALVAGQSTADVAAQAAMVEVQSQIDLWGEVEDSHDVDHQEIRRQLGSVSCILINN